MNWTLKSVSLSKVESKTGFDQNFYFGNNLKKYIG